MSAVYKVYELYDSPGGCELCSILKINGRPGCGFRQVIIVPPVYESDLSNHLSRWGSLQCDMVNTYSVEVEIVRYLNQRRSYELAKLKSIQYHIKVITGRTTRHLDGNYSSDDEEEENDHVLFEEVHTRDILITVSPSMEDSELESHITAILNNSEFLTTVDYLDNNDRVEYWIESRIHEYQLSRQ